MTRYSLLHSKLLVCVCLFEVMCRLRACQVKGFVKVCVCVWTVESSGGPFVGGGGEPRSERVNGAADEKRPFVGS